MTRMKKRLVAGAGLAALLLGGSVAFAQTGQNVDWTNYLGDITGSKYKPLDQINASNFSKLEVAWRFKTDNIGNRKEFKLEGTPLEVGGVVYATAGSRRAIDRAGCGDGRTALGRMARRKARAAPPLRASYRAAARSIGADGKEARILYTTPGYQLIALDAKTGQRIPTFGNNGAVDLKADDDQKISPDLTTGEIGWQSAPTVVGDRVLVGSAFREGFTPYQLQEQQGFGARLRRAHRQAPLAVPHHSAEGRARRGNLAEQFQRIYRQYRRLDRDHRRPCGQPGLSAGGIPDLGLLWRQASRQRSLRQQPGGGRSRYRQAEMAFPVHPSRDLGL